MSEPLEHIQNERRRLNEVRVIFFEALMAGGENKSTFIPFYSAISDYIESAMDRVNTQEMRLCDILRSRVCSTEVDAQQLLLDLDDRLAVSQAHLKRFLDARDALRREGAVALQRFEELGHVYAGFLFARLGSGHLRTAALARYQFTEEDWDYMADMSNEDIGRERALFNDVFATMPNELGVKYAS